MKTKFLHLIIALSLFVGSVFNLSAQEDVESPMPLEKEEAVEVWKTGPTFYQQVVDFLAQRGVTVTSVIDKPFIGDNGNLLSDIATSFHVSECSLSKVLTVGDLLCRIMEERYNGPHSEIMDFERIQYSSRHKDFEEYMNHYPNSPRWSEAYEKYMVTFLASYWSYAMRHNSIHYYKDFLNKYKEFSYNYCRGLYDESEEVPESCRLHSISYEGYDSIAVCVLADAAEEYLADIFKAEKEAEEAWQHVKDAPLTPPITATSKTTREASGCMRLWQRWSLWSFPTGSGRWRPTPARGMRTSCASTPMATTHPMPPATYKTWSRPPDILKRIFA